MDNTNQPAMPGQSDGGQNFGGEIPGNSQGDVPGVSEAGQAFGNEMPF